MNDVLVQETTGNGISVWKAEAKASCQGAGKPRGAPVSVLAAGPCVVQGTQTRASVAGGSVAVPRVDLGDHAAADKGGGGKTVFCAFYGGSA